MNMDFGANKAPIEVIKEGAFKGLILEIFLLASKVQNIMERIWWVKKYWS